MKIPCCKCGTDCWETNHWHELYDGSVLCHPCYLIDIKNLKVNFNLKEYAIEHKTQEAQSNDL